MFVNWCGGFRKVLSVVKRKNHNTSLFAIVCNKEMKKCHTSKLSRCIYFVMFTLSSKTSQ